MESNKHPRKQTDRLDGLFRQIGFIISLILVIFAFEWTVYEDRKFEVEPQFEPAPEMEIADITMHASAPKRTSGPPEVPERKDPEKKNEKNENPVKQDPPPGKNEFPFIPEPPPETSTDSVYIVVQDQPAFPGGKQQMQQYLRENIQYPVQDRERGIQGRVVVSFIVEADGSITNVHVPENMGQSSTLNAEAVRVVESMPDWEAGRQQDRPVRVRMNLPITFRLR
jgi:periplasmic protein TonB